MTYRHKYLTRSPSQYVCVCSFPLRIQRSAAASLGELAFYVFKSWELEKIERSARAAERDDADAPLDELEQWFLSRPLISPLLREFILFTVTFRAHTADDLTRSPSYM